MNVIEKPLTRFRATVSRGAKPRVERSGGEYGAGVIRGVSVITRGEAMGHYAWVDQFAVEQVVNLGSASKRGIKSRFTHPGLSSDGMGSMLGRLKGFRIEGERALADLHIQQSAHETPDGDLAKYVMDLAEEDPEAFGTSIVFAHDYGEEDRFESENEDEDGNFRSPDEDNPNHYRHIRLARLLADDVVDEPAANPGGLFRRGHEIAEEADKLCSYALGLSSDRPDIRHLSVDADRLVSFASRFLEHHQLEVRKKPMADNGKTAPAALTQESLDATLSAFSTKLLGQVDEKLAATSKPPEKTNEPTPEDVEKQGAMRAMKIMALAEQSGLHDHVKLAEDAIKAGMSLEAFGHSLTPRLIEQNKLSKGGNGDEGDSDPHAKFRAEYRGAREEFERFGITDEDAYVRTRCRDEGLPVPAIKKAG